MSTAIEERTRERGRYKASADTAAAIIEDLQWLLDQARSSHEIMHRLGYRNPDSLARYLHRQGEHDLANRYWRLAWAERKARGYRRTSAA